MKNGLINTLIPRYPLARTIFVDANRDPEEEEDGGRLEAKERDEILDRVMKVLLEEQGTKKVLSKRVKRIMLSYPNVKKIEEEESESEDEDEDSLSDNEPEEPSPGTPNSGHSFPDDFCPDSPDPKDDYPDGWFEETSTFKEEDYPDDFCPDWDIPDGMVFGLGWSQEEEEAKFREEDYPDPDPKDYYPDDICWMFQEKSKFREESSPKYDFPEDPPSPHFEETIISKHTFRETLTPQHNPPEDPSPQDLKRKRSRKTPLDHTEPVSKKAKRKPNKVTYIKMENPEEYKSNIRKRIDQVLKIASAGGERITYEMYEKAVIEQPRKGSEVLLQRDIDEIFINNYNPEWIVAWNANIDIAPVYDYYGTITYITDYFTKVRNLHI